MSGMDISKMGTAKVVLNITDCNRKVIDKCPVADVEYAFYQYAAPDLKQAEIETPELLSADPIQRRLRMEYIPHHVEQAAIVNDEFIAMLGRLHRYPANSEWLYHTHLWSEVALEKSLMLLTLPEKSAQQLRRFHQCSDVLFEHQSLVSGDSNAGNWGRRQNGDLVLFDWERFGKGSPAIDLAPLIKGMGLKHMFIELAERYCKLSYQTTFNGLAREIAITKAWIVTEVIVLLSERQKIAFHLYHKWYREHLPDCLDETVKIL